MKQKQVELVGKANPKDAPKKRYISPEERQQIIDELRLVPKKDAYFQKLLMN